MENELLNTIESLTNRATAKEEEANKLKKLVNELCAEAGIQSRFLHIQEAGGATTIRSDQFYGLSLTAAIRSYLEIRKARNLGAATITDIFRAIKEGGYKFSTKTDEIARIVVASALRKTSSIFHRLPNGQYGLLSWYPSAKAPPENNGAGVSRSRPKKKPRAKRATKDSAAPSDTDTVTNREVRDVILAQPGNFQAADIEKAVKAALPGKSIPESKISTVLFLLAKSGLLRIVIPRQGRTGATYAKA